MAIPEYKSKRNMTWENQGLTLEAFAQRLTPYLGAGGAYKNLGNSSTTTNINWEEASVQELNLDNNPTLTFSNGVEGTDLSLLLKSGLTQRTVTWPSAVTWSRGIQPTIATLSPSGGIDPSFLSGTGFTVNYGMGPSTNARVSTSCVLSTGKILVWNANNMGPNSYNGVLLPGNTSMTYNDDIVRLNDDGTIDTTWATNYWQYNQQGIKCFLELPDGRILVGGDFTSAGSPSTNGNTALQLLSANGTRDLSFAPTISGGSMGTAIYSIVKQSNGKIIIGGDFSNVNGNTCNRIFRLNADLTFDNTFTTQISSGSSATVYALAVDSNDTIYVGGYFNGVTVNGSGDYYSIVKLNANGAVLPFNYGTGFNSSVVKILVTSSNKIILGGSFSSYNGTSVGYITQLLPDGTIDPTFVTGTGFNASIDNMLLLPNDKVLVIGSYITDYNGSSRNRIALLNNTGAIDTQILIPVSGLVLSMSPNYFGLAIQSNGNILLTGGFSSYGGTTANAIVSINVSSGTEIYTEVNFKYNGVKYIGSF